MTAIKQEKDNTEKLHSLLLQENLALKKSLDKSVRANEHSINEVQALTKKV